MSFFRREECTDEQIAAFWTWFEANEEKLTEKDVAQRVQTLREAQQRFKLLFPARSEVVSLTTMPSGSRWELIASYGSSISAKRTAARIRVMMPASLQGKWSMEISK